MGYPGFCIFALFFLLLISPEYTSVMLYLCFWGMVSHDFDDLERCQCLEKATSVVTGFLYKTCNRNTNYISAVCGH